MLVMEDVVVTIEDVVVVVVIEDEVGVKVGVFVVVVVVVVVPEVTIVDKVVVDWLVTVGIS